MFEKFVYQKFIMFIRLEDLAGIFCLSTSRAMSTLEVSFFFLEYYAFFQANLLLKSI